MPLDSGLDSSGFVDPDQVYKNAVTKLRALLNATEEAAYQADEQSPRLGGSLDHLHQIDGLQPLAGLTDPQPAKRRKFIKHTNSQVKRALFPRGEGHGAERGERHSSWHNLLEIDSQSGPSPSDEVSLIQRQEVYIGQLEKETRFCRDQLTFVLQHVKDVLSEQEAEKKSSVVKNAISEVFSTIQGWQNNIQPQDSGQFDQLKAENAQLKSALMSGKTVLEPSQSSDVLVQKLTKDVEVLSDALKRVRAEAEDIRRHEAEAVEQVQRSVQAAEQLKMEKTELEYEIEQLKLQVERQQGRIRALIEEQVIKIDEEREIVEKRCQDQVRMVRDELRTHIEEGGRLSSEVERLQRTEMDLKRQMEDKENLHEATRQDLEKRLGHSLLEVVALNSSRQQYEQENGGLRMDLDHSRHEFKAEKSRNEAEILSVRGRLTKTEEMLTLSRQESLELTEAKAGLERQLNLLRLQMEGSDHSRQSDLASAKNELNIELTKSLKEKELSHKVQVSKLEDMIRRQSHIIGELKQECTTVTDKFEESIHAYEIEVSRLKATKADLAGKYEALRQSRVGIEAQLQERGRLHEKLCQRLEQLDLDRSRMDDDLRRSMIKYESLVQEKKTVLHENDFLKDILRSKGFLPEVNKRDKNLSSKSASKDSSVAKMPLKLKSRKKAKSPSKPLFNHAIVIERNGEISSPILKK